MKTLIRLLVYWFGITCGSVWAGNPTNPILFVTQVPMPDETNSRVVAQSYHSVASPIQNPSGDPGACGRGGALWIRYNDGSLRNLTAEAGYGVTGPSGSAIGAGNSTLAQTTSNSIAVQHPSVYWD